MSEDLTGEIQNTPSHDANAESSTAPEVEAKPEGQAEASSTDKPEEAKKPNKVQERINQLTRKNYEEKQKSADLEKRLAALESKPVVEEAKPLVAPNQDSYENYSEFESANASYIADRAAEAAYERLSAENKTRDDNAQAAKKQAELDVKKKAFNENLDSKRANFQDFDEVAFGHNFMDIELGEQIIELDKGPEIAYHLGSHLDVAQEIFNSTPIQRARKLALLESSIESLAPNKVSNAPDPITPLGNSEVVEADPDKMDADTWREWRNRQING